MISMTNAKSKVKERNALTIRTLASSQAQATFIHFKAEKHPKRNSKLKNRSFSMRMFLSSSLRNILTENSFLSFWRNIIIG